MSDLTLLAAPSVTADSSARRHRDLDELASLYDQWFERVVRWIRGLGASNGDVEDIAQEVFLIVRRKLPDFDGRNFRGWLYLITCRQVRQHRRSFWPHLFSQRATFPVDERLLTARNPSSVLEEKERRVLAARVLGQMNETRRVAFILFEIEGYSGDEIAAMLGIPVATVWTRVFHARKDFLALAARHESSGSEA
jgi:RNA polymerase sigma-70 factor, ECF subfamily